MSVRFVKKVGGISVDGTKTKANASKHAAVSHDRAGKLIEQRERCARMGRQNHRKSVEFTWDNRLNS